MRIALITGPRHADSGIGRYTLELTKALSRLGHEVVVVHPICPVPRWLLRGARRLFGWDVRTFFDNYPVWVRYPPADIYHFVSQNLATLLIFHPPPGRTVVTVHDIIPWLVRGDPALCVYTHRITGWFDRLALAGLRRADGVVADSVFTQTSLHRADAAIPESIVVGLGIS